MLKHPYWGYVQSDWAGFSADLIFSNPFFKEEVTVFLGDEFDDEGEEIEDAPEQEQLDGFAVTYQHFLAHIEDYLAIIKKIAFERYQRIYAGYYEQPERSGTAALGIDQQAKHDGYLTELKYLRISDNQVLRITLDYELDQEHGLEFRFEAGTLAEVGGIATT